VGQHEAKAVKVVNENGCFNTNSNNDF